MRVSYTSYPLGDVEIFPGALANVHLGLVFNFDGKMREFWFDGNGLHESDKPQRGKGSNYEIGSSDISYDETKRLIKSEFEGKQYVLGHRDCWKLVEFFCEKMGKDPADLDGPVGKRHSLGNSVRHYFGKINTLSPQKIVALVALGPTGPVLFPAARTVAKTPKTITNFVKRFF